MNMGFIDHEGNVEKCGPPKHNVSSANSRGSCGTVSLLAFEHPHLAEASALSAVQWARCHEINETLWAAVPE